MRTALRLKREKYFAQRGQVAGATSADPDQRAMQIDEKLSGYSKTIARATIFDENFGKALKAVLRNEMDCTEDYVDDLLDCEDEADRQSVADDASAQERSDEADPHDGVDVEDEDGEGSEEEVDKVRREAGVQDFDVDWMVDDEE